MEWALVPHWVRDPATAHRPINARAGTLTGRPMFRGLIKHNRCLVPVSGFHEWKKDGGRKMPCYLRLRDADLFAFAGLYDVWHDADGSALATYAIITTAANDVVAPIHDRMPVILRLDDEERWIESDPPAREERCDLLGPYPAPEMEAYPVSAWVSSPVAGVPALIIALEKASTAGPTGSGLTARSSGGVSSPISAVS